jgi:GH43 family beta-xylosidase
MGNRIALYKTEKMSELKNAVVKTVWSPSPSAENSNNIWAPELHNINNKWYIYFTAGSTPDLETQRLFVLENSSPDPFDGTWIEKGKIADTLNDYFAIDASVLQLNDKNYLLWSGHASLTDEAQKIYIARMANPWSLETSRINISSPSYTWESIGAPPAVNEGPEALVNPSGKIFITYSASGCWTDDYALGLLALRENGDPLNVTDWVKSPTPVFTKQPENGAYGPGHNSFFKSPDGTEDWIIYHANPGSGQGCGDTRNPRMQKFTWNSDGTPNFGEPVKISLPIKKPSGE